MSVCQARHILQFVIVLTLNCTKSYSINNYAAIFKKYIQEIPQTDNSLLKSDGQIQNYVFLEKVQCL